MLIFKVWKNIQFCWEKTPTKILNIWGNLNHFIDTCKTRKKKNFWGESVSFGHETVWGIYELGWGRSWLKAKAEAWVHSRPRIPCVPGELTWNHWSCLQLSVKQVLEALIQKSTSADFKRKFNQRVFIFRMKWSSGMKALLKGDVSTALYRARALHNNTQGACSNPSWNPQELYCCLQISTGYSTPAQEISVETVCSICPMWPLHTYGPTGQWTYSSYIFTFICIKVQWLYVWDFQILGSVLGLLLWMSGNLGQMAKTRLGRKEPDSVFFKRCLDWYGKKKWGSVGCAGRRKRHHPKRHSGEEQSLFWEKWVTETESFCEKIWVERQHNSTALSAEPQRWTWSQGECKHSWSILPMRVGRYCWVALDTSRAGRDLALPS